MSAAGLAALAAVAGLALAMVYVMVQWCKALLAAPLPPAGESLLRSALAERAVRRWGAAYAAVWMALAGAYLAFFRALGDRQPLGRRLLLLLAVAAGWIGLNVVLVGFGRGLARVGQRAEGRAHRAAANGSPPAAPIADVASTEPARAPHPIAEPRPAGRLRALAGEAAWFAGVILVMALGNALRPLRRVEGYLHLHQRAYLAPLAVLGALGFVLFLGGAVAMVLAQGRPMSRAEIEELERRFARLRLGAGRASRVAVRIPRLALGAEAEDAASFAEIKAALRARAWQVSPRWRRLFLTLMGVACLVVGLFGALIVIAPAGLKLLLAAALLYAAVRTAWGFAKA